MRILNDKELDVLNPTFKNVMKMVISLDDGKRPSKDITVLASVILIKRMVAKAQYNQDIKDFIEWGDEPCFEHQFEKRRDCPECWQSLKQLVESDVQ